MELVRIQQDRGRTLGTLLFTMALGVFSDAVFSHPKLAKPGYDLPAAEEASLETGRRPRPQPRRCQSGLQRPTRRRAKRSPRLARPATTSKGRRAEIGPPLYGVVDRASASIAGFAYSDAMKSKGGTWTFDELDKFIANPKGGHPRDQDGLCRREGPAEARRHRRLSPQLSDNPAPLPQPTAAQETQGAGQQPTPTAPKGQQPLRRKAEPTKTETPK